VRVDSHKKLFNKLLILFVDKGLNLKLDPEETIVLTEDEYNRLLEILANPPKPTEYMLEAARRYKERFKDETKTKGA
jgi:hypothetical protein